MAFLFLEERAIFSWFPFLPHSSTPNYYDDDDDDDYDDDDDDDYDNDECIGPRSTIEEGGGSKGSYFP